MRQFSMDLVLPAVGIPDAMKVQRVAGPPKPDNTAGTPFLPLEGLDIS